MFAAADGGWLGRPLFTSKKIMKYPTRGKHSIRPIAIYKPNIMKKSKNLAITTIDGIILDFGDQIKTEEDIEIGMTATTGDGIPAEGNFALPDGKTLVFEAGTLVKIEFLPEETTETMRIAALKIRNEIYHWIPEKKRFMRVCAGVRLGGKLYVPGKNGKFNTLAKDQRISRSPGKPVLGI